MKPNVIIDKILPTLNEKDYPLLDLTSILDASKISQKDFFTVYSNLDDFTIKAFYQLCAEADELFKEMGKPTAPLYSLFSNMDELLNLHLKYRFFITNLLELIKRHEPIRDRYLDMIAVRKSQLIHLFTQMATEGFFVKERFPGNFENLSTQIFMLADYWLSHNQSVFGPEDIRLRFYSKLISSMIVPYLTEKGMAEYKNNLGYEKEFKLV
ncbi:TetR/AcrR family transcriptional regulator [uncultured Cyclobacterium sp.]|uniref:TetR/AcrR family transcriptional regulator n=1 Tax=uncultured Cyclobacterium sp. TaxID=453820 RepID=UPI0030EF2F2E|tara:strand:- start:32456 stop:33088 length:633 start_codon:yes stop_codon:yes gene_type:complete